MDPMSLRTARALHSTRLGGPAQYKDAPVQTKLEPHIQTRLNQCRAVSGRNSVGASSHRVAPCRTRIQRLSHAPVLPQDPATARRMLGSLDIQLLPPAQVAGVAADMIRDVNKYPVRQHFVVRHGTACAY